jgi:hypothetical protein
MWCSIFQVGGYYVAKQMLGLLMSSERKYRDWWVHDDFYFGSSIISGSTVSMIYDQSQRSDFINGDVAYSIADSGHNTQASNAFLGGTNYPGNSFSGNTINSMNGELYHFYSFSSALSTYDRSVVEGFPLPTAQPTAMPTNPTSQPSKKPTLQPIKHTNTPVTGTLITSDPTTLHPTKIKSKMLRKKRSHSLFKHMHNNNNKKESLKKGQQLEVKVSLNLEY